jgi:hypothetical protein
MLMIESQSAPGPTDAGHVVASMSYVTTISVGLIATSPVYASVQHISEPPFSPRHVVQNSLGNAPGTAAETAEEEEEEEEEEEGAVVAIEVVSPGPATTPTARWTIPLR